MLYTDGVEGGDIALSQIVEPTPDRNEGALIGEDLRGLLQGFVLVDRDEDRRRTAVPRDRDMLATIGHLVEQIGEVRTELPRGNGLRHASKCTSLRTHRALGLSHPTGSDPAPRHAIPRWIPWGTSLDRERAAQPPRRRMRRPDYGDVPS